MAKRVSGWQKLFFAKAATAPPAGKTRFQHAVGLILVAAAEARKAPPKPVLQWKGTSKWPTLPSQPAAVSARPPARAADGPPAAARVEEKDAVMGHGDFQERPDLNSAPQTPKPPTRGDLGCGMSPDMLAAVQAAAAAAAVAAVEKMVQDQKEERRQKRAAAAAERSSSSSSEDGKRSRSRSRGKSILCFLKTRQKQPAIGTRES